MFLSLVVSFLLRFSFVMVLSTALLAMPYPDYVQELLQSNCTSMCDDTDDDSGNQQNISEEDIHCVVLHVLPELLINPPFVISHAFHPLLNDLPGGCVSPPPERA